MDKKICRRFMIYSPNNVTEDILNNISNSRNVGGVDYPDGHNAAITVLFFITLGHPHCIFCEVILDVSLLSICSDEDISVYINDALRRGIEIDIHDSLLPETEKENRDFIFRRQAKPILDWIMSLKDQ